MKSLFADTFYFLALLNPADEAHAMAKEAARSAHREHTPLVTTIWVLTELGDALVSSGRKQTFFNTLDALRHDSMVTIVPPSQDLFDAGVRLCRERPDKDWSITDCISFVAMEERSIAEALTGDHHFEQAGFTARLK